MIKRRQVIILIKIVDADDDCILYRERRNP